MLVCRCVASVCWQGSPGYSCAGVGGGEGGGVSISHSTAPVIPSGEECHSSVLNPLVLWVSAGSQVLRHS